MTNGAYNFDRDDAERRAAMLASWGIGPKSAEVIPIGHQARKPLGLAIVDGPEDIDEKPENDQPEPVVRPDNRVAWLSDIDSLINFDRKRSNKRMFELVGQIIGEVIGEMGNDLGNDLRKEFEGKLGAQGSSHEIAELKNTIGALQNEVTSLRLILENLRIRERGEQGRDGDRGPPALLGVTVSKVRSGHAENGASAACRRPGS